MKRILFVLVSFILIITTSMAASAVETPEADTNLRTLPSSVDLTNTFPNPGSQGSLGSCVAWAVCYAAKSGSEYQKRGWTVGTNEHSFSPSYIYNSITPIPNLNMNFTNATNYIIANGACTMSYFPYDVNGTQTVTSIQNNNAALYTALSSVKTNSLIEIKQMLYQGRGCALAIFLAPDFYNISTTNPIYDDPTNLDTSAGHAVCLIGYDDNLQAFKFINSWGNNSWGINGYGWISYDLVGSDTVNMEGKNVTFCFIYNPLDNYLMGDIDNDNSVTLADSRLALRYAVALETPTAHQYVIADVDGDGLVTSSDARYILRYATNLIDHFPLYD